MSKVTEIDKEIGIALQCMRKRKQWSQGMMGDLIGVSAQQIQKYESGVNRISAGNLFIIAKSMGVSVLDFFPVDN